MVKLVFTPYFKQREYSRHVAMSSKNWFGPVKGYSLLDQMTSRNL